MILPVLFVSAAVTLLALIRLLKVWRVFVIAAMALICVPMTTTAGALTVSSASVAPPAVTIVLTSMSVCVAYDVPVPLRLSRNGMATKPGSPCHSFRYDTTVLMADGTRKRISEVAIGDHVLTTDLDTGERVIREVTDLHVNRDSDMANVTVRDENGNLSTIYTTETHQFWSQTDSRWENAAALDVGELLRAFDGSKVTVVGVNTWVGQQTMYDLTIEEVHAYYITAGNEQVLVHNCGDPLPTQISGRTQRLTSKQAADLAEYNGFRLTNETLKNQRIFTNGKEFIVQDLDSHIGGTWKIADSARALSSKATRTATTDALLTPIGP